MCENEEAKTGLELISDKALAKIVEFDMREHEELKTQEACAAFNELARRSNECDL